MAAAITDKFVHAKEIWTGQIGAAGVASNSVQTIPLSSATGLPTDTAIYVSIDRVDGNGAATASKKEVVKGVVSGDNLINCTRGVEGTAQAHSAGAVVEYLMTASQWNSLIDGILVAHNQDGTLKTNVALTTNAATLTTPTITTPTIRNWDGWEDANESWAYASATTITVPSGAASKYQKGDKIKLTQTTVKYFYIVGVADTVLTITGGSDYTLANATISANYYSKIENPQGFPDWFNYTGTYSGLAATPTQNSRFRISGHTCTYRFRIVGTSNSGGLWVSLPVNAINVGGYSAEGAMGIAQDNGSYLTTACRMYIDPASNADKVQMDKSMAGGAWTASGTKEGRGVIIYEF